MKPVDVLELALLLYIAGRLGLPRRAAKIHGGTIIDSSALIDGRILQLQSMGYVTGTLLIPESVLLELQALADNADRFTRSRARKGLETAAMLQKSTITRIITDTFTGEVDTQLIRIAQKRTARLCTTDYNLQKIAEAEDIKVLNPNDLKDLTSGAHRVGELLQIDITEKGDARDQGVGFTEDGVRVIVVNGQKHVGKKVAVTITKVHRTASGSMLFAKLI